MQIPVQMKKSTAHPDRSRIDPQRISELALLTAISLIIFILELQIPSLLPIPGIKLGLANIITVYGVYRYRAQEIAMLLFCRILLGSFCSGQITALLYSFSGGALCLLGMLVLKRLLPIQNIWLCSIAGALLHNIGQISVAILITHTPSLLLYLPILMLAGCISGLFTGLCAQYLVNRRIWKQR